MIKEIRFPTEDEAIEYAREHGIPLNKVHPKYGDYIVEINGSAESKADSTSDIELFCRYTKLKLKPIYNSQDYREVTGASYNAITSKIRSYNKKFNKKVSARMDYEHDSVIISL